MTPQEEEFLTQIAAGTDPLTALAAMPEANEQPKSGCLAIALLIALAWGLVTVL